jgi:hypothetical protein
MDAVLLRRAKCGGDVEFSVANARMRRGALIIIRSMFE